MDSAEQQRQPGADMGTFAEIDPRLHGQPVQVTPNVKVRVPHGSGSELLAELYDKTPVQMYPALRPFDGTFLHWTATGEAVVMRPDGTTFLATPGEYAFANPESVKASLNPTVPPICEEEVTFER